MKPETLFNFWDAPFSVYTHTHTKHNTHTHTHKYMHSHYTVTDPSICQYEQNNK
jgi:hypothetical protein